MAKELLRVEHIGMKFNLSKERVNDFREYVIRMLNYSVILLPVVQQDCLFRPKIYLLAESGDADVKA